MKLIDITGQKFGDLTVMKLISKGNKSAWLCRCVCGNEVVVFGWDIRAKPNISCGCARLGVKVGQRFGLLTVVEVKRRERFGHGWKIEVTCKCDCGGVKTTLSHYLTRGTTNHCGCLTKERQSKTSRGVYGEGLRNVVINSYKYNAKIKGLEFDLSVADMIDMFNSDCYYCGDAPSKTITKVRFYGSFTYNGIDRLDSTKGYTKDNTVPCCETCNYLKSNYSKEEFLNIIMKIAKQHQSSYKSYNV